jgi:hypothetical protein
MRIIIFTILVLSIVFCNHAKAATCYGSDDCHACHTCGYCANCNEPGQTHFCGVYYMTHGERPRSKKQNRKSIHQYVNQKNKRNA